MDEEPTPEEAENGWTKEELRRYMNERDRAQHDVVFQKKQVRAREQNHSYSPHKWRR